MMSPYIPAADPAEISVLTENIGRLHTTAMGAERIKRNIQLEADDAIRLCQTAVLNNTAFVRRMGKNWYITVDSVTLTVNAHSYTVITAHMNREFV